MTLSRINAQRAVDLMFEHRVTALVYEAMKSRDRDRFVAGLFALHSDFDHATGIIDINFPE